MRDDFDVIGRHLNGRAIKRPAELVTHRQPVHRPIRESTGRRLIRRRRLHDARAHVLDRRRKERPLRLGPHRVLEELRLARSGLDAAYILVLEVWIKPQRKLLPQGVAIAIRVAFPPDRVVPVPVERRPHRLILFADRDHFHVVRRHLKAHTVLCPSEGVALFDAIDRPIGEGARSRIVRRRRNQHTGCDVLNLRREQLVLGIAGDDQLEERRLHGRDGQPAPPCIRKVRIEPQLKLKRKTEPVAVRIRITRLVEVAVPIKLQAVRHAVTVVVKLLTHVMSRVRHRLEDRERHLLVGASPRISSDELLHRRG